MWFLLTDVVVLLFEQKIVFWGIGDLQAQMTALLNGLRNCLMNIPMNSGVREQHASSSLFNMVPDFRQRAN